MFFYSSGESLLAFEKMGNHFANSERSIENLCNLYNAPWIVPFFGMCAGGPEVVASHFDPSPPSSPFSCIEWYSRLRNRVCKGCLHFQLNCSVQISYICIFGVHFRCPSDVQIWPYGTLNMCRHIVLTLSPPSPGYLHMVHTCCHGGYFTHLSRCALRIDLHQSILFNRRMWEASAGLRATGLSWLLDTSRPGPVVQESHCRQAKQNRANIFTNT
jgi:hypothetical protein|mmetsp:Transcript_52446/g.86151  ORF Transcript_52446/g.86151 Transcript_52446/m.86151 type:complete len:215 (-) Transcript_52446:1006-1650(-)